MDRRRAARNWRSLSRMSGSVGVFNCLGRRRTQTSGTGNQSNYHFRRDVKELAHVQDSRFCFEHAAQTTGQFRRSGFRRGCYCIGSAGKLQTLTGNYESNCGRRRVPIRSYFRVNGTVHAFGCCQTDGSVQRRCRTRFRMDSRLSNRLECVQGKIRH